jgi:SEC-C motif
MRVGRNQGCPCGSGLKFKKCCLTKEPTEVDSVIPDSYVAPIPSAIVDDVVDTIFSSPDNDLSHRLQTLADSQPHLWAFITPMSSSLPTTASFSAALSAIAIIWMFQQYHQRQLPMIGAAAIARCLDRNAKSFFNIADVYRRPTMTGKHQPSIHKFIADTVLDFDEGELDSFNLSTLFMMLKTTADVLHVVIAELAITDSQWLYPASAAFVDAG